MAKSILVVDDDLSMCELLRIHLSSAGYDVTTAADGIEAGYAVLKSPPDLIITDVNMPNMNGYEFVAALKSEPSLRAIPVVFLTLMDDFDLGKQLGAVGYVTKPVRADKLLSIIAEHLPGGTYPIG